MVEVASEDVQEMIAYLMRKSYMIRSVGGIALCDVQSPKDIPDKWYLDLETEYFVPPNFYYSDEIH